MSKIKLVCYLLLFTSSVWAQTETARITGTVADGSGAVIPGASVTVSSERTGLTRTVEANERGLFVALNLPPAVYKVVSQAEGLGPAEFTNIALTAGQERVLNIVLQPAAMATEINVSGGDLVVIDTSSARVGANVNEREVANLPLNGRQLSQLYLMAPGAQTSGGGSYDNVRFSGRANQQNAVRFDGVEASSIIDSSPGNLNGETSTGFRLQSSLENVQEFRVESSNYPAEYGTGTAGQISIVTKSGGNTLHGSVFEYLRNSAMDARNFFDGAKAAPLRLNQFGGSLGGPILKEKLFFFASYEGLRQRAYQNLIEAVPSTAARARAVPSIAPLMAAYPTGVPTVNPDLDLAQRVGRAPLNENYGSIRLDYRLSPNYNLTARYFRDQGVMEQPLNVTGNVARTTAVPQNGLVSLQQVLRPTVINEIKVGFNGSKTRYEGVAPTVNGIDLSAVSLDFSGTATVSGIGGQGVSGGAARIGGLVRSSSAQNGRAVPYTNYTLTFSDQLSWIKGNHSLKFGVEVRPIRMYTDRLGGTTYTYSNVNALLSNTPSSVQVIGDVSAPNPLHGGMTGNRFLKQEYYIGYVQDEWKISRTFTMNYGLRYEYYSPLRENRNLFTFFDMTTGKLDTNPNRSWYGSSKANFGPRLAFTWAPGRLEGNTVLRVGAGYYYGPGQTEDQVQPIDSDRVTVTRTTDIAFPVNSQAIVNSFDVNNLKNFAPRVYAPGYTLPEKILSYTASIQQKLPFDTVLTAAYVGSQGRNLFLRSWTNLMVGVQMNQVTGAGIPVLEFGNQFSQMDYKTSGGTDRYDSLQVTANRRFTHGLTVGTQWTWGHSIGNTGGSNEAQTQQNPLNFEQDRGNNAFDVRHTFNATALYALPFGRDKRFLKNAPGWADMLLGNWELGGVMNARTGMPVDLTLARNDIAYQVNSTGQIVDAPMVSNGLILTTPVVNNPWGGSFRSNRRPSVVPGVNPYLTNSSDKRVMLNPAAFTIPAPGEYGNLGRWALKGPGLAQFDLTLHKRFPIREGHALEFRGEIYNLLNRANFANPVSRLNNSLGIGSNQLQPGQAYTQAAAGGSFGMSTSTVTKDVGLGAGRQIQLSLRYSF
ncbi:MAG TPA: carboxypeptidase regulatory-like domain-containing protein [Bryobacteraceae bacterium]|nr:carboxypeptidase regulatory-like domain-containing protein [Bryobacteraceae bacterium]